MEIRLLGPTEVVHDDGTVVVPGATKVRQMLALLAHEPGRTRSVEVIIDEPFDARSAWARILDLLELDTPEALRRAGARS